MNAHDADGHEATPRAINTTGTDRLLADVEAVPLDQQALGLAEAILDEARYCSQPLNGPALAIKLGVIQGNAERLIPLLERQAEEKAELVAALEPFAAWADFIRGRAAEPDVLYARHTAKGRVQLRQTDILRARALIAEGGAPLRNRASEALDRIAGTLREGEALEGTYEERCERSTAAAFTELDKVIVIAREAQGGAP